VKYLITILLANLIIILGPSAIRSPVPVRVFADSPFDLQAAIDAAAPGDTIQVPPGEYHGHFVVEKPLTLEGVDWPVLDGDNKGSILQVNNAPDVVIRGLVLRNTGTRLDKEDAAIRINQSPRALVENNRLENVLFGIDVKESEESRLLYNVIGSKADLDVAARGDSIRVWYSKDSQVIGNQITHGRDVLLWYNVGSIIRDNLIKDNRYGLHFMYCDSNIVENNRLEGNSVGAYFMYGANLILRRNIFVNNRGPSGYGLGLKDLDGLEATDNLFSGNRVGAYFDNTPWSLDVKQHFTNNAFVYNEIGLFFNPSVKRNFFSHNSFVDNGEQVGLTSGGDFTGNGFTVDGQGNYWSDYTGYDADGDGRGDLPYVSKSLFENMMDNHPQLRLFQLSPAQQAIDLAAQAFPIFQPKPKFSDDAPLLAPISPQVSLPAADPAWPMGVAALLFLVLAGGVVMAGKAAFSDSSKFSRFRFQASGNSGNR
jgi:nitrous oxidase accessory protein